MKTYAPNGRLMTGAWLCLSRKRMRWNLQRLSPWRSELLVFQVLSRGFCASWLQIPRNSVFPTALYLPDILLGKNSSRKQIPRSRKYTVLITIVKNGKNTVYCNTISFDTEVNLRSDCTEVKAKLNRGRRYEPGHGVLARKEGERSCKKHPGQEAPG